MVHYSAKAFTSQVQVEPDTIIHCAILNGAPCTLCEEFHRLQEIILEAMSRNAYITLAHRERDLDLRRQMNARHDLLNVFPIEIRAEIFAFYCSASPPIEDVRPQITLLSVCETWRYVAMDSPRLWTVFPVPAISQDQFCIEEVERWLQRSKDLAISLEFKRRSIHKYGLMPDISMRERSENAIAELVLANKGRIHMVNTATLQVLQPKIIFGAPGKHDIWIKLSHITMDNLEAKDAIKVLRCFPQAIFVEFKSLRGKNSDSDVTLLVVHSCLQVLKADFCYDGLSGPSAFLDYISAPALTEIACQSDAGISPIPALEAFILRSACALSVLHLRQPRFLHDELLSLLKSQNSLRMLSIGLGSSLPFVISDDDASVSGHAFEGFMRRLLTNPMGEEGVDREYTTGEFLPHLEVIKYAGKMVWPRNTLTDVYVSHTGVTANRPHAQGSSEQRESSAYCRASYDGYRPLRLLRFLITGNHHSSSWTTGLHGSWWNRLIELGDIHSRIYENECHLECYFISNIY